MSQVLGGIHYLVPSKGDVAVKAPVGPSRFRIGRPWRLPSFCTLSFTLHDGRHTKCGRHSVTTLHESRGPAFRQNCSLHNTIICAGSGRLVFRRWLLFAASVLNDRSSTAADQSSNLDLLHRVPGQRHALTSLNPSPPSKGPMALQSHRRGKRYLHNWM
jgi:hypothetical protein